MVGVLALGGIGCASSTKLENESRVHSLRADSAAQARDYSRAAQEQAEAQRLHDKAVQRAYKEGTAKEVVVPADVPAPEHP
jgi:hypothetical protein